MTPRIAHALIPLAAVAAAAAPAAAAPAPRHLRHVPRAEATAGEPLPIVAAVPAAEQRPLVLHYRAAGAAAWIDRELARRPDGTWVAEIPARDVAPPGLEYYIAVDGGDAFASPAAPHRVEVRPSATEHRRDRDFARADHRRSRSHVAVEYVDYGSRRLGDREVPDRYYRIDADFAYRLYAYPLEEVRIGYTRLLGTTPDTELDDPSDCGSAACALDAGFKVAGWFELGVGLVEGVRADARGMVMATPAGFAVGGRGELRAGVADATHVAIGAEYLADVGSTGYFRLGWFTVPALPMAATVEVTDLPARRRATGVRLVYDVAYPMPGGLRLGLRLGYAARDEQLGGITAGAAASFDF